MAKGTGKRFPAVAGRRNRMPKEVQSAPQQRTSERPPATPNRGIDHTAVLIGILATVAAAVVGAWILAAWPSLPRWLVIDFLALLVLVIALLLTRGRRRLQWSSAAVGCLVLIGSPAIAWLTQPSETERRVAAYLDSVCHENFWVDESAVCYSRAGDFIVERFDAFNPDRWHAWDELPDATAISAQRLSPDAPGIAGSPILVAGRVLAVQRLGGLQQAIQLRPMTVEESVAFMASSEVAAAVSDESDRATLAATSLESDIDYSDLIYCNLPTRPFFMPQQGDVVVFTGTLIASGKTEFIMGPQAGKQANLTYVACSSAERFRLQTP